MSYTPPFGTLAGGIWKVLQYTQEQVWLFFHPEEPILKISIASVEEYSVTNVPQTPERGSNTGRLLRLFGFTLPR